MYCEIVCLFKVVIYYDTFQIAHYHHAISWYIELLIMIGPAHADSYRTRGFVMNVSSLVVRPRRKTIALYYLVWRSHTLHSPHSLVISRTPSKLKPGTRLPIRLQIALKINLSSRSSVGKSFDTESCKGKRKVCYQVLKIEYY